MTLRGTNQTYNQVYNERVVLQTIRTYAPLSRADIARRTNLTLKTVTYIVRNLREQELVLEKGPRPIKRGKPPIDYVLNPDGAFAVGLHLGRSGLRGVLIDFAGNIRQRLHHTLDFPTVDEAIPLMEEAVGRLTESQKNPEKLSGVGVGIPGPHHSSTGEVVSPYFPGWDGVPVVDLLTNRLNLPVYLDDVSNAAAVGERWYGAGRLIDNFVYIFLGIGLGAGLVVNGQPYRGHEGNAGRLNLIPMVTSGLFTEITNVIRPGDYFPLIDLYQTLQNAGYAISTPEEIIEQYQAQNEVVFAWLETLAQRLAPLLVTVGALLDPEAIFLGGLLPEPLIDTLLSNLERLIQHLQPYGNPSLPRLLRGQAGIDATALGVATLPFYADLSPSRTNSLLQKSNKISETATD